VESSVALHRVNCSAKGVDLRLILPGAACTIDTDPVRLRQIIDNLLSNAVKFTDKGEITVEIRPSESRVAILVADTGIGIVTEELERIFEPFHQVENFLPRRHRGTGLGLSLARQMATLMGGQIEVHSTHGEGSVFTVTLPRSFDYSARRID